MTQDKKITDKSKKVKEKDKFYTFAKQVGKYLESVGWQAAIVGGVKIAGNPRKHKYLLIIDFLGGKKK